MSQEIGIYQKYRLQFRNQWVDYNYNYMTNYTSQTNLTIAQCTLYRSNTQCPVYKPLYCIIVEYILLFIQVNNLTTDIPKPFSHGFILGS